jgi:hypothetical protein
LTQKERNKQHEEVDGRRRNEGSNSAGIKTGASK